MVQYILEGDALEVSYLSTLTTKCIDCLTSYLLGDTNISAEEMSEKVQFLEQNLKEDQLKDVYILRGLLSFDVFHHSLMKRWSVDYGYLFIISFLLFHFKHITLFYSSAFQKG